MAVEIASALYLTEDELMGIVQRLNDKYSIPLRIDAKV